MLRPRSSRYKLALGSQYRRTYRPFTCLIARQSNIVTFATRFQTARYRKFAATVRPVDERWSGDGHGKGRQDPVRPPESAPRRLQPNDVFRKLAKQPASCRKE